MRSGQKGGLEQAHTMLRMVLPKGTSFEFLTQWDVNLIAVSYTHLDDMCGTHSIHLVESFIGLLTVCTVRHASCKVIVDLIMSVSV